jgi:MoxR-like ATPase
MWMRMAMATAMLQGRDHVVPADLQECAVDVMAHRIVVAGNRSGASYVEEVVRRTPIPK